MKRIENARGLPFLRSARRHVDLDSRQIFRGDRTNTVSMIGHSGLREDVVEISNLLDFYRNGGVCCSECLRESGSVSRQASYELGIKFKIVKTTPSS
jgi:hypothetical protein